MAHARLYRLVVDHIISVHGPTVQSSRRRAKAQSVRHGSAARVAWLVGGRVERDGIFSGIRASLRPAWSGRTGGWAAIGRGVPGVFTVWQQSDEDWSARSRRLSISAGLDYPGVGPEHSYLASIGRAEYPSVTDAEVIEGFKLLAETEGIIPALECAHAVAWISREAPSMQGQTVLMNLSGRGDKDVGQMMDILGGGA